MLAAGGGTLVFRFGGGPMGKAPETDANADAERDADVEAEERGGRGTCFVGGPILSGTSGVGVGRTLCNGF